MMKSQFFEPNSNLRNQIEEKTKTFLTNTEGLKLPPHVLDNPRSVGGAIEQLIKNSFEGILLEVGIESVNYKNDYTRKAFADFSFSDAKGINYSVDVKTHRHDVEFNMPNLTSVRKLATFYKDDTNYFVIFLVSYKIEGDGVIVDKVNFVPIEFLDWSCVTIGALGWGQIQIKDSGTLKIETNNKRDEWMLELCNKLSKFYPREIIKIDVRIKYFEKIKEDWLSKAK